MLPLVLKNGILLYWGLLPISLCNAVFKLVATVIANRLKGICNEVVSVSDGAFTHGRLITDNIIVAFEAFHLMHYQGGIVGP